MDNTAYKILGHYLFDKDRKLLFDFAKIEHLWTQRIAIVSTLYFIKNNDFEDALKIIGELLSHEHDLIHKANGWMLREIGKKEEKILENFLNNNIHRMPRTTLRYALERMPEESRQEFLNRRR